MSEASRHRYLFLKNRLEELLAKYGPPDLPPPMGADLDPSWGPVGSLAEAARADSAIDELLWLERERTAQEPPPPPLLHAADALQKIDRYGETPLFGCPTCGEEFAKASLPLNLWHCTACGTSGRASDLAKPDAGWTTPVHLA